MRTGTSMLLVSVVLFALSAAYYLPFISDDALISLRYSQRFAAGEGLTWNLGERVEGYSNLLWVVLSSAMMRIGFDGILFTFLALSAAIACRGGRKALLVGALPLLLVTGQTAFRLLY